MFVVFKDYLNLSLDEHIKLLAIRNQDYIRNVSFNTKFIDINEHKAWLKNLKDDRYFAVFLDNEIIGGIKYVANHEKPSWGVFFDKNANPIIKSACVYEFIEWIFTKHEILYSYVKKTNQNSIKFTKNFGFTNIDCKDDMLKFSLEKNIWEVKKRENLFKTIKKFGQNIKFSGEFYG